jgi:hypothetical protein
MSEYSDQAKAVLDRLAREPMPEYVEALKCNATPEQVRELEAAWAEYLKGPWQNVPLEVVPDDPVERQVEMLVANLPADSTGVLIVKLHGDCIRQDDIDRFGWSLRQAVSAAGLSVSLLFVVDTGEVAFDFQLLTNDQLRDIGFKRVEPTPNYFDITKASV